MKSHKFIDYTYLEIKSLIDTGCMAVVPTGCTEQQGPHLPVDFDTWFAEAVALEAAQHATRCHDASTSSREVDWNDPQLDFTKYSDTGVIGDASQASAELGRRLWQEVISTTAAIFRDCGSNR